MNGAVPDDGRGTRWTVFLAESDTEKDLGDLVVIRVRGFVVRLRWEARDYSEKLGERAGSSEVIQKIPTLFEEIILDLLPELFDELR